jgi:hypothetical protein
MMAPEDRAEWDAAVNASIQAQIDRRAKEESAWPCRATAVKGCSPGPVNLDD